MKSEPSKARLRTEGRPAPGRLVLVHGFLNTWSDELGIEDFDTPRSTEEWMRDVGLWSGSGKTTKSQHQRILRFRDQLRAWVIDKTQFNDLNELISKITFGVEVSSSGELSLQTMGDACDTALGALIEAIFDSTRTGTWDRLRCCDLPTCGWAFYDSTRSRTKRWCSMKTCGSRHKAREYYKRSRTK